MLCLRPTARRGSVALVFLLWAAPLAANDTDKLDAGVVAWNTWRIAQPNARPDLSGVTLRQRDLRGANLSFANLQDAVLERVDLRSANLRGADLRGANLGSAQVDRFTQLDSIVRDENTRLPGEGRTEPPTEPTSEPVPDPPTQPDPERPRLTELEPVEVSWLAAARGFVEVYRRRDLQSLALFLPQQRQQIILDTDRLATPEADRRRLADATFDEAMIEALANWREPLASPRYDGWHMVVPLLEAEPGLLSLAMVRQDTQWLVLSMTWGPREWFDALPSQPPDPQALQAIAEARMQALRDQMAAREVEDLLPRVIQAYATGDPRAVFHYWADEFQRVYRTAVRDGPRDSAYDDMREQLYDNETFLQAEQWDGQTIGLRRQDDVVRAAFSRDEIANRLYVLAFFETVDGFVLRGFGPMDAASWQAWGRPISAEAPQFLTDTEEESESPTLDESTEPSPSDADDTLVPDEPENDESPEVDENPEIDETTEEDLIPEEDLTENDPAPEDEVDRPDTEDGSQPTSSST